MESYFPDLGHTQRELARERVLADLRALTTDSELLLKATANDVGERAAELRARLESTLTRAKSTLAELQERGLASAREAARQAETAQETLGRSSAVSLTVPLGISGSVPSVSLAAGAEAAVALVSLRAVTFLLGAAQQLLEFLLGHRTSPH